MKLDRRTFPGLAFASPLLLLPFAISCSHLPPVVPQQAVDKLPCEATIKTLTNCGSVFITARVGEGEEGLFILDTGATTSALDSSLAHTLGRCRGYVPVFRFWSPRFHCIARAYDAPVLHVGELPLRAPGKVLVYPQDSIGDHKIIGVLGTDYLKAYCVQFELEARKLRFLDPHALERKDLGHGFPMKVLRDHSFVVAGNLGGDGAAYSILDTGDYFDGTVRSAAFKRILESTNAVPHPLSNYVAWLRTSQFGGVTYTNVFLHRMPRNKWDSFGLNSLRRHLVTVDYPNRTLYLSVKRTDGPPMKL